MVAPLRSTLVVAFSLASLSVGCDTGAPAKGIAPDQAPSATTPKSTAAPTPQGPTTAAPEEGVLRLGAAIEKGASAVALGEVAKKPDQYVGKTFTTTGTVSAVCQHMGCWMEIKDDASAAHIKMAGHAFFVPKTASGRKARVLATLVKADTPQAACEGEGHEEGMAAQGGAAKKKGGCRAEAEAQLGRPLAKLELVAQGVELL